MFRSLQSRLWLSYFLLVGSVLCVVAVSVAIYLLRNPAALRQAEMHLEVAANVLQRTERWIEVEDKDKYLIVLRRADQNLNARFLIIDSKGTVVADSRMVSEAPIPASAINKITNQLILKPYPQYRDENQKTWIYTFRPLQNGMNLIASNLKPGLTVAQFFREDFLRPFLRAGLIALLLSLLLAWLTSQWITRPLEKITRAAHLASSGQYQQIPLEGPGEVQTLAKSFNEMTSRVQGSQKSQRDFIANVSHDLKTPLTSIQGFAQAILDGTAETPEAVHRAAEVIHSEVSRMHHLVLDLLELARLDSGVVKITEVPVDLKYLLEKLVARFTLQARQAGKNLEAEISALPEIIGDPDRLSQAVSNLLDNALKFSPTGEQVILRAQQEAEQIVILVSDTGPGISPEDLPLIFERFYQADKSRSHPDRGTGLGLSITREIVQAHGGKIVAYNNPPEKPAQTLEAPISPNGCTFVIKLPVARAGTTTLAGKPKSFKDR